MVITHNRKPRQGKFTCLECDITFNNAMKLGVHIYREHKYGENHINSEEYYNKYFKNDDYEGTCIKPGCTNKTMFMGMWIGYNKYCSPKCCRNDEMIDEAQRKTCYKRYGVYNIKEITIKLAKMGLKKFPINEKLTKKRKEWY